MGGFCPGDRQQTAVGWVSRSAYRAAITCSGRAAWRRRSIYSERAGVKPHQLKQIRAAIPKARLGFKK
jgi:hypothetical protein